MLNKQLTVRLRSVEDNLQTDESDWECIMDSEDIKLEVFVQKDIFLVFWFLWGILWGCFTQGNYKEIYKKNKNLKLQNWIFYNVLSYNCSKSQTIGSRLKDIFIWNIFKQGGNINEQGANILNCFIYLFSFCFLTTLGRLWDILCRFLIFVKTQISKS